MQNEGVYPPGKMTIRVFYPNPLSDWIGTSPLDGISKLHQVSYLEILDPIYHELVFIDDKKVRHHIIGLPYHVEEKMEDAGGIDGVS
jgi:hypothetical protein